MRYIDPNKHCRWGYPTVGGLKARCWKPPGHYQCIPEQGRPDCVISIEIGVNGDAYPVAISPKVTKILPVSFYSPMSGFNIANRISVTNSKDSRTTRSVDNSACGQLGHYRTTRHVADKNLGVVESSIHTWRYSKTFHITLCYKLMKIFWF